MKVFKLLLSSIVALVILTAEFVGPGMYLSFQLIVVKYYLYALYEWLIFMKGNAADVVDRITAPDVDTIFYELYTRWRLKRCACIYDLHKDEMMKFDDAVHKKIGKMYCHLKYFDWMIRMLYFNRISTRLSQLKSLPTDT